jgi:TolB-like protein/DNA-binding winged helix-turn-helix (wHTH) protein/Flp pilus assembly protein TadD
MTAAIRETVSFGEFKLDPGAYELRRGGLPLKISRQQMELLILLIERRTQLVSRAEIIDRLWTPDVFVDVDTGINSAISKIRQALGDSAETPRFVETVPGKGYRFIADVVVKDLTPAHVVPFDALEHRGAEDRRHPRWLAAAAGIALIAAVPAAYMAWRHSPAALMNSRVAIAVLPFEHLGEPASGYLAEGLTSETSASLAQIDPERLSVKGRTLAYKGTRKSAAEIGRDLSADYLVEGTIRSAGHRVRVTTQLLRVRDQEHVWSASYERESGNLLALQQELSRAIAEQIRHRVSGEPLRALGRRHTHDPDAYDAYLKARYLQGRRKPATNAAAVQEFERALGRDPSYALAWAGLALTHAASVLNGDAPPREVAAGAREAAARAVTENANLAEVQMAVAYVNWLFDWDWSTAAAAAERATRLDPSSGAAWRTLGHVVSQSGRHAEAAASMARARELEPLEPMSYALSSQVAFQARDYKVALDHARRAVATDPDIWVGHMMLGQTYDRLGMTDLALEALADAARLSQGNSKPVSLRGYILATGGRTGEAREVLRTLQAKAERQYVPPYALALVHAGLGDRDAVFHQLSNAVAGRDVHLILLGVEAKWDPYRPDPRFADLLARCAFDSPLSVRR